MQKTTFRWLFAALICSMSLAVTSCKDDDKNELSEEEQVQRVTEEQEQNNACFAVLDQLVDIDRTSGDFLTQTYEPNIGQADASDANTRIVNTNTMELAAERFANLVDVSIDENTQTYTWTDDKLGTLTYNKSADGKSWATVDVDVKQVPHLHKIVYRSPEQGDNNANFEGRAYYRFGDVIMREGLDDANNEITEYWVCVRPAFGLEGKEDSHWLCLNALPNKNILTYKWKDENNETRTWRVPQGLGTNKEHMQNLAEMLYAILNPEEWENNIRNTNNKMPMFHDFHKSNVDYHNKLFWEKVGKGWDSKDVWSKVFTSVTRNDMKKQLEDPNGGLRLLYNGYSWSYHLSDFFGGWNCKLWEAIYTNGTGKKANMHNAQYTSRTKRMKDISFDCRDMGGCDGNYCEFFDNDDKMRWCVRHALGSELSSTGKYDVRQPIPGFTGERNEVYRYYRDAYKTVELLDDPEITSDCTEITYENRAYFDAGDVVKDKNGNFWFCVQPSTFGDNGSYCIPYAYFISLGQKAVGDNLEELPMRGLAMQILFDLDILYHSYITDPSKLMARSVMNIRKSANVLFDELFGLRDSIVIHKVSSGPEKELVAFISTLYRENNELYVLRGYGDYTVSDANGRDWAWKYWGRYTTPQQPERQMRLSDLADQGYIDIYNEDEWVHCSWYDWSKSKEITTNTGVRTKPEAISPLSRFIYKVNRTASAGTVPANMYREPIIPFAVERVKDEGRYVSTFESGLTFTKVQFMKEIDSEFCEDEMSSVVNSLYGTYQVYGHNIFYNGITHDFGMDNIPGIDE